MPIRFAAANAPKHAPACSPIAKAMVARAVDRVANDNGDDTGKTGRDATANGQASDLMLRAALRHFAEHGLGAAREARAQAEKSFFDGDRQAYHWWLGITRTLDRKMAQQAEQLRPELA